MSTIAERIVALAQSQCKGNMSEFARKIGVTPAYISKFNRSPDAEPSNLVVNNICNMFNVNESWLRTGEGEMFRPLDTTEQVAKLLRDVIRTDGSESWQESRRIIIESLAGMPPEFWEQAGAFVKDLADRQRKTE